ncbi:superoxide dismutase family protein [Fulvivirga sedimenti]|uniref:Superoxide dismutase family protein n=1 Tax=Fulvivirga sedimenti TaxID=2879465 RepID=A0A9X1L0L3_9BACT|nr:superoxide dismutase family protein [Fulvivirga sedimenti]MCA6074784.1 superoxide dismutase family protein [Fulvivirga sedimenti]MCA6075961.1 superoxide dismutase family protein [Fulvivirga sedimenti]MCA6077089.1 superoxide dismutase family protein [Fulvivirga sedimenti]
MKYLSRSIYVLGFLIVFGACSTSTKEEAAATDDMTTELAEEMEVPAAPMAMASMSPASGSNVTGTITFTQTGDNTVQMDIEINHLVPGSHAIHLHEKGDCSADDASSAGGHWNPSGVDHGNRMGDGMHHAGDIINLEAGADSTATNSLEITGWTIGGDSATNILNHAVIIHAGADDFTSQPSGAAGGRVSCGVIREQ